MIKRWLAEVDGRQLLSVSGDDIATYITEGETLDFWCHLQHFVVVEHFISGHRGEQTDDMGLVGTDNKVERLLCNVCIGGHFLLMFLLLIGNGHDDVAIALYDFRRCVCFP